MEARRYTLLSLIFAAIAASAWVFARPAETRAYQHVHNGGFEQGTDGWRVFNEGALDTAESPEVEPTEGQRAARGTVGGIRFEVQQLLPNVLEPGVYALSIDIRSEGVPLLVTATLLSSGDPLMLESTARAEQWTTITGDVTISQATTAEIRIRVLGIPGDVVYIDNVRVEGAPPVVWTVTPTPTATSIATIGASATVATATPDPSVTATPVLDAIADSVRNGGFEEGDGAPFAWERYGGSLSSATAPVRSGERAARLESDTASTKWMHQIVAVSDGAAYAFEAWIAHADPNVASAFLRVSWYTSDDGSGEAISTADSITRLDAPAAGYRYLTTGAIASPLAARTARVRIMLAPRSDARAAIYVDDASWVPAQMVSTPVPVASLIPHASGSGGTNAVAGSTVRPRARAATSAGRASVRTGTFAGSGAAVVINEVLYDSAAEGGDAANEWVELFNAGSVPAALSGWTLADAAGVDILPDMVIEPGDFIVVAASDSFREAYPRFSGHVVVLDGRIGNSLNNDGDALMLVDSNAVVVDAISWGTNDFFSKPAIGDVPAGHSIERRIAGVDTNRATDFVDNDSPSPGEAIGTSGRPASLRPPGDSSVEIIRGTKGQAFRWLPWALAASSVSALATLGVWRAVSLLRERAVARG